MSSPEQNSVIAALEISIKMEIDGKAFYLEAARGGGNQAGQRLFNQLAAEEDAHRTLFEKIYDLTRQEECWPDMEVHFPVIERTLFAEAAEQPLANADEIEAVKKCIDLEASSFEFYEGRARAATYEAEKGFYNALAAQERGHQLALVDYLDYLQAPAGYFTKTAHPSLDGG
jgi:rubrerythrin